MCCFARGVVILSKIIVAGAGVGGLCVAAKLASEGHFVTVFEKNLSENIGYDQTDFVDEEYFGFASLEYPEKWRRPKNRITLVPLDETVEPITLPAGDGFSLAVDRRELFSYLKKLCDESGVVFNFGCEVLSPIVCGSRVVGIKTSEGDFFSDLVIDSLGANSPVRAALPELTHIQNELSLYDRLYTYRAYFSKDTDAPEPETDYNIFIKHNGDEGLSWIVTGENVVDVLIASFHKIDDARILEELVNLARDNPHMGKKLVRGGQKAIIPVRQPLSVFVADGFAAIGDSACMTYPVKGSGIGYSLVAATLLFDAVKNDSEGLFTLETLWEYEAAFFKKVGFEACRLALMKNLLPYVTAKEVSDLLKKSIFTTEELVELYEKTIRSLLSTKTVSAVKDKLKLLGDFPESRDKLLNALLWFGRWKLIEPSFPTKYNRAEIIKWAKRYDEFFDDIKRSEVTELF